MQYIDDDYNAVINKMIDSCTLFWVFTPMHIATVSFWEIFQAKYWTKLQSSKNQCTLPNS